MVINTNMSSLKINNSMNKAESAMNKSIEKLSSGLRINRAADDAAGLAISEKMKAQIRGYDVAKRNINDGISMVQTAEGAMVEIQDMVQRLRELTVQGTNGTYTSTDTANLQAEANELLAQINEIATKTDFNGVKLLSATGTTKSIQVGLNAGDVIEIKSVNVKTDGLGIDNLDVTNTDSLAKLDKAIDDISKARATLGATQNRLEHTLNNVTNVSENISAAKSRITDADMAKEMAEYTKNQVLVQAGISIASQANQNASLVTQLIR